MKKITFATVLLTVFFVSIGFAQQEAWQTHTRGLLHQSVFNTGALGVQYNFFRTVNSGDEFRSPMEWPGNSKFTYLSSKYWYYNSNGAGMVMLVDTGVTGKRANYLFIDSVGSTTTKGIDMIGCLGQGSSGTYRDGTGVHYWPGTVIRTTNYPLNTDGSWNLSYNPNEAEEIIVSSVMTPYGITITRTSRAWSYPGYDSFIIYDYEFKNTGMHFKYAPGISPTHATDTLSDICVSFVESLFPSYAYANMQVGDFTSAASKELSRFDLTRYMQYVHSPDGRPHTTEFAPWSANGTNGGGLMAPAAVGYMLLYYDYDKLMPKSQTRFVNSVKTAVSEQLYDYDVNNKFKQPWVIASTQANLTSTKILTHVQGTAKGYFNWNPRNTYGDSLALNTHFGAARAAYWYGRARPNANYNYASPMVHSYAVGPYQLAPDQSFHVVMAEVAGFGPGRKWDSKYYDMGGGNETVANQDLFHPVPSWDSVITYPINPGTTAHYTPSSISSTGGVGIAYTPTYGLPGYIRDTTVVSIRDVADRAIQLYTGNSKVIKYDSTQYEPWGNTAATANSVTTFPYAPSPASIATRQGGWNAAFKIPLPAPILSGYQVNPVLSGLTWKNTVESLNSTISPFIARGLQKYEVVRSTSALGPWTVIETVSRADSRYWNSSTGLYLYRDLTARMGAGYYYAVVAVDSAGKKSALTNMLFQKADLTSYPKLGKVYAVPNPYFLVSGFSGQSATATNSAIQFYGLTSASTIHIFSFSGQLIKTLHSDGNTQSVSWDLRSESLKKIASGVYYFTVQDDVTGDKAWNKFVVTQ